MPNRRHHIERADESKRRDPKRTPRAKERTLARKQQRAAKRANRGW